MTGIHCQSRILKLLRERSRNFDALLSNMWGIYPTDLMEILEVLVKEGSIKQQNGLFSLTEKKDLVANCNTEQAKQNFQKILAELHDPHSLDYEWWFTLDTLEYVCQRMQDMIDLRLAKLCFLGSPLVGAFCHCMQVGNEICIVDISAPTLRAIEVGSINFGAELHLVHHDLQHPLPKVLLHNFDLVFLDPPWYVDYYQLFISRAVELIDNGLICVALFPLLTRPRAIEERYEIFERIVDMGLIPVSLETEVLGYKTPFFEEISLTQKGIKLRDNWRKGDLLILTTSNLTKPFITGDYQIEMENWREVVIGRNKVKIKINNSKEYEMPSIEPLYSDSEILKSVSRRAPERKDIGLWTSGHRVFKLSGNDVILIILECLSQHLSLGVIVEYISQTFKVNKEEIWEDVRGCYNRLKEAVQNEIV